MTRRERPHDHYAHGTGKNIISTSFEPDVNPHFNHGELVGERLGFSADIKSKSQYSSSSSTKSSGSGQLDPEQLYVKQKKIGQ